jgi:hypothetical protein
VKFHLKTWSLLSGMTLSLALVGGCSSEAPPDPTNPPPAVKEEAPDAAKAPTATATEPPATPPPAVEAPATAPAPSAEAPKEEAPKDEPKKEEAPK